MALKLFKICPSNLKYIELLARANKIAFSDEVALAGFYNEISSINSGIEVASFFLGYWRGGFSGHFEAFAKSMLEKDISSFFSCCRHLLQSDLHFRLISQFIHDKGHCINAAAATLFQAQLYDFQGDHANALSLINKLISGQPGSVDYLLTKARICKVSKCLTFFQAQWGHGGSHRSAATSMQTGAF